VEPAVNWKPGQTRGCRGKVRFPTAGHAARELEALKKESRQPKRKARTLHTYRCRECQTWHIGHDKYAQGETS